MFAVLEYKIIIAGDEEDLCAKKEILDREITPLIKERTGWISAGAQILTAPTEE